MLAFLLLLFCDGAVGQGHGSSNASTLGRPKLTAVDFNLAASSNSTDNSICSPFARTFNEDQEKFKYINNELQNSLRNNNTLAQYHSAAVSYLELFPLVVLFANSCQDQSARRKLENLCDFGHRAEYERRHLKRWFLSKNAWAFFWELGSAVRVYPVAEMGFRNLEIADAVCSELFSRKRKINQNAGAMYTYDEDVTLMKSLFENRTDVFEAYHAKAPIGHQKAGRIGGIGRSAAKGKSLKARKAKRREDSAAHAEKVQYATDKLAAMDQSGGSDVDASQVLQVLSTVATVVSLLPIPFVSNIAAGASVLFSVLGGFAEPSAAQSYDDSALRKQLNEMQDEIAQMFSEQMKFLETMYEELMNGVERILRTQAHDQVMAPYNLLRMSFETFRKMPDAESKDQLLTTCSYQYDLKIITELEEFLKPDGYIPHSIKLAKYLPEAVQDMYELVNTILVGTVEVMATCQGLRRKMTAEERKNMKLSSTLMEIVRRSHKILERMEQVEEESAAAFWNADGNVIKDQICKRLEGMQNLEQALSGGQSLKDAVSGSGSAPTEALFAVDEVIGPYKSYYDETFLPVVVEVMKTTLREVVLESGLSLGGLTGNVIFIDNQNACSKPIPFEIAILRTHGPNELDVDLQNQLLSIFRGF